MNTDLVCLSSTRQNLYDCVQSTMKKQWDSSRSQDCRMIFVPMQQQNLFRPTCCSKHKKRDKAERGFFKEELRYKEMTCIVAILFVVMILSQIISFFAEKVQINERLKTVEMVPCPKIEKYWKCLYK